MRQDKFHIVNYYFFLLFFVLHVCVYVFYLEVLWLEGKTVSHLSFSKMLMHWLWRSFSFRLMSTHKTDIGYYQYPSAPHHWSLLLFLSIFSSAAPEGKRSAGLTAVWVARNRFAVLDRTHTVGVLMIWLWTDISRVYFYFPPHVIHHDALNVSTTVDSESKICCTCC